MLTNYCPILAILSHPTIKMAELGESQRQSLYAHSQDASGTVVCQKTELKGNHSSPLIITAAQVVKHKEIIYPSGWARCDLARPGSLRLVPPQRRVTALEQDYMEMGVTIFG